MERGEPETRQEQRGEMVIGEENNTIENGGVKWAGEMMKLCDGNGGKVEQKPWQKAKELGMKEDQGEGGVY